MAILHVKIPDPFDITFVITIPFVLLIVLKVTVFSGSPIGSSTTLTDEMLFSNISTSKNPLSILSPVSLSTIITSGD